jgi:predicted kinase
LTATPELNLTEQDLAMLRGWVSDFLQSQQPLFARRVAGGFIRDCDGDLHADNICLTERICIFDCIEFNERFRYSDTAADIAFLLMDLDFHQKASLGEAFLQEYIEVSGDREVVQLLDFYKVYRAFVRGKVESFKLYDPGSSAEERQGARQRASRYFRLARGYLLRQRLPPSLIITSGLMGSGKSTIANELAFELGLAIASSDLVRKELAAVPPTAHAQAGYGEGIYTPAYNRATYEKLLVQAETTLRRGESIVVDATFRSQTDRRHFQQLAERLQVPYYIIQTGCPEQLVKERLAARQQNPAQVSDGRWELFYRQQAEFAPPTAGEGRHIFINTGKSIGDNLDTILRFLGVLDHVA